MKYCLVSLLLLVVNICKSKGQVLYEDTTRYKEQKEHNSTMQVKKPYIIPATCIICPDGIIDIYYKVFGGTPPYSYQWSNGSTNTYVLNVLPGYYNVTVSDASGYKYMLSCYVPAIEP